jgi:hypothetical protein
LHWHKKRYKNDIEKTNILTKNGISLIRVREKGLKKIAKGDIIFSEKTDEFKLITYLLHELSEQYEITENIKVRIHRYLKNGKIANDIEYVKYLDMLPSPLPGFSLRDYNRELCNEWHPSKNANLAPQDVTPNSHKKVWWVCKNGHEWRVSIANRNKGRGCPYCAGQKVCIDNCLKTLNLNLANEWHPTKNGELTPEDVVSGSRKKVWWLCKKRHEWKASIFSRSLGTGCPYCAGKAVCDDNCLKILNPSLAAEWHPTKNGKLTPYNVRPNSHKKVWWKCKKHHEWPALISHRNKGIGCPYCSGKLASKTYNLKVINPIMAKQWHPFKNGKILPTDVTPNSHKKAWWLCDNGHEWYAQIASRNRGNNCPYCSGRRK